MPGEKGPQDACGVFGVWAPGEDVAKLAYFGLYALQHRGQESAGIATGDGHKVLVYKDMGLVSQVFNESALQSLTGHVAIGHCRYSTTGGSTWENAQPTLGGTDTTTVALAHNGNLINSAELRDLVAERHGHLDRHPGELGRGNTTDTALVTALLALRYIDNHGNPSQAYPANPNGSPAGVTGVTTADGRFTIMMPHPERAAESILGGADGRLLFDSVAQWVQGGGRIA